LIRSAQLVACLGTSSDLSLIVIMEGIQTHPSNAAQAKAFTAPGSLSFPGATNELTPPASNVDGQRTVMNGQQVANGNGVTPATPAATPAANQGPSGITPTLQYVYS
jgi:transcription initiation factor TFIID TATA-box-binding protein